MESLLWTIVKLLIFLPMVIALILWLGKIAQKYSTLSGQKSNMKVVERLPIAKENALLVVKIGEKFYLVTSSPGKVDIVREMEEHEVGVYKNLQQNEGNVEDDKIKLIKDHLPQKVKNILRMKE